MRCLLGPGDELGDEEQREGCQTTPGGRRGALAHHLDVPLDQPPTFQHVVDAAEVAGRQTSCAGHEHRELVVVGARAEGEDDVRADRLHDLHSAGELPA